MSQAWAESSSRSFFCSLDIVPVAKARARVGKYGAYTPEKTKQAEHDIGLLVRSLMNRQGQTIFDCPVQLELTFKFERPKSSKNARHTVKPDLDNLCKLVNDALNGILWRDDALIVKLSCQKIYTDKAGIDLFVSTIT